ncbi:MAG TPA: CtsR family transcriptional regulator [Clostridia bacterium]|nr:CtsR family transcriptional regulator [Clostridia bacterium]
MKFSDLITEMILRMLSEADGIVEIQRNEMANRLGCVPSQINYVITSRFTPEQGYFVESRRGGGGYIRITRIKYDRDQMLMHIVNSIGDRIDAESARIFIDNLSDSGIVGEESARLMRASLSNTVYRVVPQEIKDNLRAEIFKRMLLSLLK